LPTPALDYRDLKIKVVYSDLNIMGPLKQCDEIVAISKYCLIVLL